MTEFYQTRKVDTSSNIDYWNSVYKHPVFIQLSFSLDPDIKQFQRSIYSLLDVMGDTGGLLEFCRIIG